MTKIFENPHRSQFTFIFANIIRITFLAIITLFLIVQICRTQEVSEEITISPDSRETEELEAVEVVEEGPPDSFWEEMDKADAVENRRLITHLAQLGITNALNIDGLDRNRIGSLSNYPVSESDAVLLQDALDTAENLRHLIIGEVGYFTESYLLYLAHIIVGYQELSNATSYKIYLEEYINIASKIYKNEANYEYEIGYLVDLYIYMNRKVEIYNLLDRFLFISQDVELLINIEEYERVYDLIKARSEYEGGSYVYGPDINELYAALVKLGRLEELKDILHRRLVTLESDAADKFFKEESGWWAPEKSEQIKASRIETLSLIGMTYDALRDPRSSQQYLFRAIEEAHKPPFSGFMPELAAALPTLALAIVHLKAGNTDLAKIVLEREFNGERSFFEDAMEEGGALENFRGIIAFVEQDWEPASDSFLYHSLSHLSVT